ncbi:MAG: hypothetical protein IPP79_14090 [Chitinophagaceae bacterium]|nr:hypothetical protein [Chitinophagaceae bacterium]
MDDIVFNEKNIEFISVLKDLIKSFPKVKFVATSEMPFENILPTEYLTHNDIFKASIVFIQNFSSKEIKQLIQKWYSGKEIDLQDNMQRLIKSFRGLRPMQNTAICDPFSVDF